MGSDIFMANVAHKYRKPGPPGINWMLNILIMIMMICVCVSTFELKTDFNCFNTESEHQGREAS